MADKTIIREVPADSSTSNILLWIIIILIVGWLIWAVATWRINNFPAVSDTKDVNVQIETPNQNQPQTNNPSVPTTSDTQVDVSPTEPTMPSTGQSGSMNP